MKLKRFSVLLIRLDPAVGAEIQKTRPCVLISPDEMNFSRLRTVIIAPMTTTLRANFPTRIDVNFQGKKGRIALDRLRAIDRTRIVKVLGMLHRATQRHVLTNLQTLFQE